METGFSVGGKYFRSLAFAEVADVILFKVAPSPARSRRYSGSEYGRQGPGRLLFVSIPRCFLTLLTSVSG